MNLKEGYIEKATKKTKRYCQFLRINPNTLDEYKYWHNCQNIWKEIPEGIRKAGILNMEIYLISDLSFMIIETSLDFDWDKAFEQLSAYDKQSEWEDFVAQFQLTEIGKRSEEKWKLMERIFSLEEALNK